MIALHKRKTAPLLSIRGDDKQLLRRTVLLADDSVTIQKVVNLTFADEGIDVISVGNGDLAMTKIFELRPDVVLADVNMPGLTGYEICERLRADETMKDLPVVLLVGSFEPFDEDRANRVGANGFLTKPFQSIRQLVAMVSELTETVDRPTVDAIRGVEPHEEPTTEAETVQHETNDIDHLYKESFAETIEIEPAGTAGDKYPDAGMDDEMIETIYGKAPSEPAIETNENAEHSPFDERIPDEEAPRYLMSQAYPGSDIETVQSENRDEVIRFEGPDEPDADESFEFTDSNLLELPPVTNQSRLRLTGPDENTPSHDRVVSLSPELLDVIVQRVVKELSERR